MAATKIRLEAGSPLTGTVKFIDYYAEKPNPDKPGTTMSAQWALTGNWGEAGEGKVYIDAYQLGDASPLTLGMAEQIGTWDDGNPRYKWTYKGPVVLTKVEKDRKRHVYLSRVGEAPAVAATAPAPAPTPAVARAPSVSASPAPSEAWTALYESYERAAQIAIKVWGSQHDPVALAAATATVFIEANKRGLAVRPALDPAFHEPPPALAGALRGQPNDGLPW